MGIIKRIFEETYNKVAEKFGKITNWEVVELGKENAVIFENEDFLYIPKKNKVKVFLCPYCFSASLKFKHNDYYDDLMKCGTCKNLFLLEEAKIIEFTISRIDAGKPAQNREKI